jgi:hypothetical protein
MNEQPSTITSSPIENTINTINTDIKSLKTELEMSTTNETSNTPDNGAGVGESNVAAGAAAVAVPENIKVEITGSIKSSTIETDFASKTTTRMSSIMSEGINFLREVASEILDKIVVGDTPLVVVAMELTQWAEKNMKQFSGQDKKRVVLKLLNWLIDNQEDVLNNALGENKDELHHLVDLVIPSVLDAVCAAAKGKFDINATKKIAKSCITYCCASQ